MAYTKKKKTSTKKTSGKVTGKVTGKTTGKKPGGQPGKRPRAWTMLVFDDLEEWRQASGLPKKRAAEALGVTNSTYHNWARGIAIPNINTQVRLVEQIKTPWVGGQQPSDLPTPDQDSLTAVARIVEAYADKVEPDDLPDFVLNVRRAITQP